MKEGCPVRCAGQVCAAADALLLKESVAQGGGNCDRGKRLFKIEVLVGGR